MALPFRPSGHVRSKDNERVVIDTLRFDGVENLANRPVDFADRRRIEIVPSRVVDCLVVFLQNEFRF